MTLAQKLENQKTLITNFWGLQFKCSTFAEKLLPGQQSSEECCTYARNLTPINILYQEYVDRYCSLVIPPPEREDVDDLTDVPNTVIVIPPKTIYPNPETDIPDEEDPPPSNKIPVLPVHELPPQPTTQNPITDTTNDFTSFMCESFSKRRWGCLLAVNGTSQGFQYCPYGQEPETFWESILDAGNALLEEILMSIADGAVNKVCTMALLRIPLPFLQKAVLVFGCNQIDEIANHYWERSQNVRNFGIGGKVFYGEPEVSPCPEPPREDVDDPEDDLVCDLSGFKPLAVPVEYFNKNYESKIGLKSRLEITFRWSDYSRENKVYRVLSLPSPKEGITRTELLALLPRWLFFEEYRYELNILPYGFIRYYGISNSSDVIKSEVLSFLTGLVVNLIEKSDNTPGELVPNSFKVSHKVRGFNNGWYFPYSANILGWNDDNTHYISKGWIPLYRNAPTEQVPPIDGVNWRVD